MGLTVRMNCAKESASSNATMIQKMSFFASEGIAVYLYYESNKQSKFSEYR